MKKFLLTALILTVALLACSCRTEPETDVIVDTDNESNVTSDELTEDVGKDETKDENENQDGTSDDSQETAQGQNPFVEEPVDDEKNGLLDINAILEGSKYVIELESLAVVSLFDLSAVNEKYVGSPSRYALADRDNDGVYEMIVEFSLTDVKAQIKRNVDAWTVSAVENEEELSDLTLVWQNF